MKAIKLLIFIIIGVLLLGAIAVTLIYFYTDTFKPNQEIFYKYISGEKFKNITGSDTLKNLINKSLTTKNKENIKITISENKNGKTIADNATVKLDNYVDLENKMLESSVTFGNVENEDVIELGLIKNYNIYGAKIENITNGYLAVENSNLKKLAKNLGVDSNNIPNKITLSPYTTSILNKCSEITELSNEIYTVIRDNTTKKKYSKIGKQDISVNNKKMQATGYELALKGKELEEVSGKLKNKDILNNLDIQNTSLFVRIYIQNKQLVKYQLEVKEGASGKYLNIEKDAYSVKINYNDNENNILKIDVAKAENNSDTIEAYNGTVTIESDGLVLNIGFTCEFDFAYDFELKALNDENSSVVNEIEGQKTLKMLKALIKRVSKVEEIEDTVLEETLKLIIPEEVFDDLLNNIYGPETETRSKEAEAYNARFSLYAGVQAGAYVSSLIKVVETNELIGDTPIILKYNGTELGIPELTDEIDINKYYTISFEYNSDGYINIINIDE